MFKAIKEWWIKRKQKKVTAQNEAYLIVYRDKPDSTEFHIKSIHKTLQGAKKFYDRLCKEQGLIKEHFYIERYGMWD